MRGERIGELLKECRERAKLSQEQLAKLLHIDQAIVSKIENGKIPPAYTVVKEWARVTKAEDLISMDLAGGKQGWQELSKLKDQVSRIRELVFMRIVKKAK